MFKCDEIHSMDSKHFVEWIETTASTLRAEHGKATPIAILIDNATWHNKLTPESEPPKRAWQKALVADWLTQRKIKFELYMTKAELLELAFQHLPPREYIVDRAAMKFDVQIVRIPVKHCVLNPIELVWSGLKDYVRKQNVRFNLNDISQLCNEWLSSLGPEHAIGYFKHVEKHEQIFKTADKLAEELDNEIIDSDDESDNNELDDDEPNSD